MKADKCFISKTLVVGSFILKFDTFAYKPSETNTHDYRDLSTHQTLLTSEPILGVDPLCGQNPQVF